MASVAACSAACDVRNSRHIFQQTQSSRMPPASSNPTISSNVTVIEANAMRRTVAARMPTRMARIALLLRQSGGGQTDDNGVVTGQHEIDHQYLK